MKLLFLILMCLCQTAYADFNSGDVFGKGIIVQASGVTVTGGGRTLNFASGVVVTVNNNAYQVTSSSQPSMSCIGATKNGFPFVANLQTQPFTTNVKGTIVGESIVGSNSSSANCSASVDIWKVNAAYPTIANTIVNSNYITLTNAKYASWTTSGWSTTAVSPGDTFVCTIHSVNSCNFLGVYWYVQE